MKILSRMMDTRTRILTLLMISFLFLLSLRLKLLGLLLVLIFLSVMTSSMDLQTKDIVKSIGNKNNNINIAIDGGKRRGQEIVKQR